MIVSDYLDFAVKGELKPLTVSNIGGDIIDNVQKDNREILISYLNLAIVEIFKRFALLQKEYVIEEVEPNTVYDLPVDFMYAVSAAFPDGAEISLNDEKKYLVDDIDYNVSIMFPAPFKILFKGTDPNEQVDISLLYVATPCKVSLFTDYIDIPEIYTEALINFMAYKAYSSLQGDMQATNNTFYLRFIDSCKGIDAMGLKNSDNLDSNIKLNERGFV